MDTARAPQEAGAGAGWALPAAGTRAPLGATPLAPRQVCVPGSVLGPRVVRPCQSRALDTSLSVSSPQSPVAGGG